MSQATEQEKLEEEKLLRSHIPNVDYNEIYWKRRIHEDTDNLQEPVNTLKIMVPGWSDKTISDDNVKPKLPQKLDIGRIIVEEEPENKQTQDPKISNGVVGNVSRQGVVGSGRAKRETVKAYKEHIENEWKVIEMLVCTF